MLRSRRRSASIRVLGTFVSVVSCHGHDRVCLDGTTKVVSDHADLASAPMLDGLSRSPATIYSEVLAFEMADAVFAPACGQTLPDTVRVAFSQTRSAEVLEYVDGEACGDEPFIEVPTHLRVSDASATQEAWSFVAEGGFRIDAASEAANSGRWEVTDIVLGGRLAEAAGEASAEPSEWAATFNHASSPSTFFVLQLTYGNPEVPGSRCVMRLEARK